MARIEYLINNPTEVTSDDLDLLNAEIEKYPYFYSLRALKLLALKNSNDSSYDENLQITAVLSSDRKDLYNYIHNISNVALISTDNNSVGHSIQQTNSIESFSFPKSSSELNLKEEILENEVVEEIIATENIIAEIETTQDLDVQQEFLENKVVEEIIATENIIAEIETTQDLDVQEEVLENEVIEEINTTDNIIAEIETTQEMDVQEEVLENEVVEEINAAENIIAEIETTQDLDVQEEVLENEVVEEINAAENIITEIETTQEIDVQEEVLENEVVEEINAAENLIAEIETTQDLDVQEGVLENEVVEEIIATENIITEIETTPEINIQEEVLENEVVEEIIATENIITEIETTPEINIQEEVLENEVVEEINAAENIIAEIETIQAIEVKDEINFDSSIAHSLEVAEQFLQKDNEIANAVSETLDINTTIENEPKIEQISLVNRSVTNPLEMETNSKPVSNINSFQVQNTYDVVKGAPTPINEDINDIEPENIISEIDSTQAIDIQDEVLVNESITEIDIDDNNSKPNTTEEIIKEEPQPIPTEETIEIVEKATDPIDTSSTENVKESINKVDFIQTNDSFSFNDWLKLPSAETMETEKEQKYQIIDEFLEKNPKITPLKKQEIPESKVDSKNKTETDFSYLMTETLAQVYIDQKQYEKAIRAYKILSLKYPEKNSLFANQIKEIENLKNSK